jgi:hypothetical protein
LQMFFVLYDFDLDIEINHPFTSRLDVRQMDMK